MGTLKHVEYLGNGKAIASVEVSTDEIKDLEGENQDIYLFTSRNITTKTKVAKRGKHDSSTYMLVPLHYRNEILKDARGTVRRIDSPEKIFFVYMMNRPNGPVTEGPVRKRGRPRKV